MIRLAVLTILLPYILLGEPGDERFGIPEHVDLGGVTVGSTKTLAVPFINSSDHPITIVRVGVSCGCTHVSFGKSPIGPGKVGDIDVSFSAGHRLGITKKSIYIYTTARDLPIKCTISADIKDENNEGTAITSKEPSPHKINPNQTKRSAVRIPEVTPKGTGSSLVWTCGLILSPNIVLLGLLFNRVRNTRKSGTETVE